MASHVEKLIKASAWASLSTPTEKLISVWFAATYPKQPLDVLFKDVSKKEIIGGIGSRYTYVNRSLKSMSQNTVFIKVYKNLCSKRGQEVDQVVDHVVDQVVASTKESERERESSPQTPFIEKGKGKENPTSTSRAGACETDEDDSGVTLSDEQKASIRTNVVTQGSPNTSAVQALEANTCKDQVVGEADEPLNDIAFEAFFRDYPNRWGLVPIGYIKLKSAWRKAEQRGWTGEAILDVLLRAREQWSEKVNPFIPDAFRFLNEEWMRTFLPFALVDDLLGKKDGAQEVLKELTTLADEASFRTFCMIYPNKRGLTTETELVAVRRAWKACEKRGWAGATIVAAVKEALFSDRWMDENGRYVPMAKRFLREEQMRQFLPNMNAAKTATSLKYEAEFEAFASLYPRKADFSVRNIAITRKFWKQCEGNGWTGGDILRALKEAIYSKLWTDENGRFIPSAAKFLEEEQMRNFLPVGFQPRGHYAPTVQPDENGFDPMAYGLV